ncbi:MAG: hypothetical protein HRU19_16155 [Pseudobacteriovorax sp.]|nr:hypothetical protein [Pseudobacteriovorax sp.]
MKPQSTSLFTCMAILLMASSCTKTKKEVVNAQPWYETQGVFSEEVIAEAEILPLVEKNCASLTDLTGLSRTFTGTKVSEQLAIDFKIEGNDLVLHSISENSQIASDIKGLTVCDEDAEGNTVNGVANLFGRELAASKKYHDSLNPSTRVTLPSVNLDVLPLTTSETFLRVRPEDLALLPPSSDARTPIRQKNDDVYNAFWSFQSIDGQDTYTITIWPHPKPGTAPRIGDSAPLWTQPFVARHEYGHHVFASRLTRIFGSARLGYKAMLQNNPKTLTTIGKHRHQKLDLKKTFSLQEIDGDKPAVDTMLVIGAVNESFADLFAYFSSGDRFLGLESAPCFQGIRDPGSRQMAGWLKEKNWTPNFMNYIFDQDSAPNGFGPSSDAGCDEFSLRSPHSLGGVIAYTVNQMFEFAVTQDPSLVKGDLLLNWISAADSNLNLADNGPRQIMSHFLKEALLVANEGSAAESSTDAICNVVRDNLSGWKPYWPVNDEAFGVCLNPSL